MKRTVAMVLLAGVLSGCGGVSEEDQERAVEEAAAACNGLLANEPKGGKTIKAQWEAGADAAARAVELDEQWKPLSDLADEHAALNEELFAAKNYTELAADFPQQVGDNRNAIIDECREVEQAGGDVTASMTKSR